MRVALLTLGTCGDVQPLFVLAVARQQTGHCQVRQSEARRQCLL